MEHKLDHSLRKSYFWPQRFERLMEEIQIHGKTFVPYITFEEIDQAISRMANSLSEELKGERPLFIGVLNGVVMFMSDFLKRYQGECEIAFIRLASYQGMQSSGEVELKGQLPDNLEGRHVVILEDIVDTGNTLVKLHQLLDNKDLKSLRIASLLFKPDAYKKDLDIDYVGLQIPDKFVVGYGLDYDGIGRNLPDLYQLKEH